MFHRNTHILISVLIWLLSSLTAHATDDIQQQSPSDITGCLPSLKRTASSTITSIIDHQTLKLKNNQIIRLSDIHFPTITKFNSGFFAQQSRTSFKDVNDFLQRVALDQDVFYDKMAPTNRYGYLLTPLFLKNQNKSLQYLLIKNGLALFYSVQPKNPCLPLWRDAEKQAKSAQAGIWRRPNTIIRQAKPVKKLNWQTQKFQIIKGIVHAIGQSKKLIYLNFDKNWRKDFTITIEKKNRAVLEKSGLDIMQLTGKTVQVRGWLEWYNGPTLRLNLPANLEILEP